jgi:hypothetical protein
MYQENELISLMLFIGVAIFIFIHRGALKAVASWPLLLFVFVCSLTTAILTVVEGAIWSEFLNFVEHAFYLIGSIGLLAWCISVSGSSSEEQKQ